MAPRTHTSSPTRKHWLPASAGRLRISCQCRVGSSRSSLLRLTPAPSEVESEIECSTVPDDRWCSTASSRGSTAVPEGTESSKTHPCGGAPSNGASQGCVLKKPSAQRRLPEASCWSRMRDPECTSAESASIGTPTRRGPIPRKGQTARVVDG
eukprot:scaffold20040_cov60-Phaeocystis_antarctica.AAC.4